MLNLTLTSLLKSNLIFVALARNAEGIVHENLPHQDNFRTINLKDDVLLQEQLRSQLKPSFSILMSFVKAFLLSGVTLAEECASWILHKEQAT